MIDWWFRNRRTGEITVAQSPNAPAIIFVVALALRLVVDPGGSFGTALDVVVAVAIVWWSLDEMLRGVNPWRRFLGAAVLMGFVVLSLR